MPNEIIQHGNILEVAEKASATMADIPANRTLMVIPLTDEAPDQPSKELGLDTTEAVFEHYKPSVEVNFTGEDGSDIKETFNYKKVSDFEEKGILEQSEFLNDVASRKAIANEIETRLSKNKPLGRMLSDPESKAAFIATLESLAEELKSTDI